jgi:hypothetical protein
MSVAQKMKSKKLQATLKGAQNIIPGSQASCRGGACFGTAGGHLLSDYNRVACGVCRNLHARVRLSTRKTRGGGLEQIRCFL